MIKVHVISGHSKWKEFIIKPNDYLKKRLKKLSKNPSFEKKKYEFSIILTNKKKMKK